MRVGTRDLRNLLGPSLIARELSRRVLESATQGPGAGIVAAQVEESFPELPKKAVKSIEYALQASLEHADLIPVRLILAVA